LPIGETPQEAKRWKKKKGTLQAARVLRMAAAGRAARPSSTESLTMGCRRGSFALLHVTGSSSFMLGEHGPLSFAAKHVAALLLGI
jgi:hypothetical protein